MFWKYSFLSFTVTSIVSSIIIIIMSIIISTEPTLTALEKNHLKTQGNKKSGEVM